MEKSELKLQAHAILAGEQVIDVWYRGELIAAVYGADGAGIRVMTKHPLDIVRGGLGPLNVNVIEVRIEPS